MTASKRSIGSDLHKVDAYVNTEADYEELPELDDAFFDRAKAEVGDRRRGRPPLGSAPKQQITLRLDPEIERRFRSAGPGWQVRMNDFLANNEMILKMIVDFDDAIDDMEKLVDHFRKGELRAVFEPAGTTISRIEKNIRNTRETVRSLREQLVWEPQPPS